MTVAATRPPHRPEHADEPRRLPVRNPVAVSIACAALGAVLFLAAAHAGARDAWFAYLDAWTCATTIAMGALFVLMTGHAAKASWMVVTRRLTEAIVDLLPVCMVLFVPIALTLRWLYPWAGASGAYDADALEVLDHQRRYMAPAFVLARSVFYFAVFVAVGLLLRAWSHAADARPSEALVRRMRRLSGGGLPVVALVFTWASFDWWMSLAPGWSSTIYGLYAFAGAFVGAIALLCVMLHVARARPIVRMRVTGDHAQALGRVLFAMTAFWAYMAFSQLLIYWIADIPQEVSFYAARMQGSWRGVTYLLVFGHFVLPFFLLLNRLWKRSTAFLAAVGAWMLFMHLADVSWLVLPARDPAGFHLRWADVAAVLFVGGVSCAWIAARYRRAPPFPLHAPELAAGFGYRASV